MTLAPRSSRLLLLGCGVVLAAAVLRIALHDPTDEPVSGDQASFTYQALSLLGGDLAYDASDQERWLDLGWVDQPHGLFLQARDDGWAFAKPLGYSVLLAPAIGLFGGYGISLVGAGLVLAYAACWYGIGRLRWDRPASAAVATAATVASHAWLFGFPAHADLFVAVLVGIAALGAARVAWRGPDDSTLAPSVLGAAPGTYDQQLPPEAEGSGWRHRTPPTASSPTPTVLGAAAGTSDQQLPPERLGWARSRSDSPTWWLALSAAATGLLVTEKLPALLALAPLLLVAVVRAPGRARLAAVLTGAVVLAVSVAPYLFYSDGASWSAYGGDRYYAIATTPWSGGTDADLTPWQTRDSLTPSFVLDSITDPSGDIPSATLTYAVGRHTGVATFQPVVAALAVAIAVALWCRRPAAERAVAVAAAVGLAAYVGLYLVAFTDNYFGGGQSVGNRYFLQVSVLVAVVAAGAGLTSAAVRWCAAAAAVLAVAVLGTQLRRPEEAFFHIERTSAAQRVLPFDGSQVHAWRFRCEPAECVAPPLEAYDG